MGEFAEMAAWEREARRIARRRWFWLHAAVCVPIQLILFVIWIATGAHFPWSRSHSSAGGSSSPCTGSTPS